MTKTNRKQKILSQPKESIQPSLVSSLKRKKIMIRIDIIEKRGYVILVKSNILTVRSWATILAIA